MQIPDPDRALQARIQQLQAGDDETGDGKVDIADLKRQLDRIEAQLELQDAQNRRLLRSQRQRLILNIVVLAAFAVLAGVLLYYSRIAYDRILQASAQVNELAATLQSSLATLDSAELDEMMQTLPDLVDQLSQIDVDALNEVLQKLPGVMDSVEALQTQTERISGWLSKVRTETAAVRLSVSVQFSESVRPSASRSSSGSVRLSASSIISA